MTRTDEPLFISWIEFHGRSAGIAQTLEIDCLFVSGGTGNLARRYFRQWKQTRAILTARNPRSLVVMLPPLPILLAILSTRAGRRAQLIGDLHTGVFSDPKWMWALSTTLRILSKRGLAVVTNEHLAHRARAQGCETIVLHNLIVAPSTVSAQFDDSDLNAFANDTFIFVPLAYASDEPLAEIVAAATLSPTLTWVLTGRAPQEFRRTAPANVVFTGYISNDDYSRLLRLAAVVCALTTREFTMQQVGYEAVAEGKTLVTSSTESLRTYFDDAAVYTDATAADILRSVRQALANTNELGQKMAALKIIRQSDQNDATDRLRAAIA